MTKSPPPPPPPPPPQGQRIEGYKTVGEPDFAALRRDMD